MTTITIRGVDQKIWREFKSRVVAEGMPLGKALTVVMSSWIMRPSKSKARSIFDLQPVKFAGADVEHLSEKVDEVLYS